LEAARTINELQYSAMVATVRAETAWLEGRPAAVGPETETAFNLALELGAPRSIGELACWRWRAGLLTDAPPDAEHVYRLQIEGHAAQAIAFWSGKGLPYETALARFDSGDPKEMRRALNEFRALEATPAAAIVTRRLRQLGERSLPRGPRQQTRANPHGLTARELQVLSLLTEGLRNSEIAHRLIVSRKTVDHHVSAILRKLAVQTRGEAAAKATQLGLRHSR
jgi:DNA-binding CsgD family transcriptional regulator